MRQPFIPGAWNTHLFRTVFSREINDRMQVFGSCFGAIKFRKRLVMYSGINLAFYPNLIDVFSSPVGKKAYTITGRNDLFKVFFQFGHGQVNKYVLPHHIGWLYGKPYPGNKTQSPETNHSTRKPSILTPRKVHDGSIGTNKFQ